MEWGTPDLEIGSVSFLSSVSPRALARLEEHTKVETYEPGDIIFREGDPAGFLYVIRSGRVEIVDEEEGAPSQVLRVLGTRELLGELGILGGHARSATARAAQDCELWAIEREAFLEAYETEPGVAVEIAHTMARYLLDAEAIAADLLFLDLQGRLAKRLLTLAGGADSIEDPDPARIAALAGGTKRRIEELLDRMARGGLIAVGDRIELLNRDALIELATYR